MAAVMALAGAPFFGREPLLYADRLVVYAAINSSQDSNATKDVFGDDDDDDDDDEDDGDDDNNHDDDDHDDDDDD